MAYVNDIVVSFVHVTRTLLQAFWWKPNKAAYLDSFAHIRIIRWAIFASIAVCMTGSEIVSSFVSMFHAPNIASNGVNKQFKTKMNTAPQGVVGICYTDAGRPGGAKCTAHVWQFVLQKLFVCIAPEANSHIKNWWCILVLAKTAFITNILNQNVCLCQQKMF